jgi:hypothetical protein
MSPRRRETVKRPGGTDHLRPRLHVRTSLALAALGLLPAALLPHAAHAFTVTINSGKQEIYLQVGVGSFTGLFDNGGTPGNNTTVNNETVTLTSAVLGNGTAQAMTTNSTAANSFYDNYTFCTAGTQLYIGGFYQTNSGNTTTASVTAAVPANLTDAAGNTIPFSQISWTSSGNGDSGAEPFPAATFVSGGGTQTVGSMKANTWNESCWTFSYANTVVPAAGTYTGTVTYTLTAP